MGMGSCCKSKTYFQCNPSETVHFWIDARDATCSRWAVRDITISDITAQIGVTTEFFG